MKNERDFLQRFVTQHFPKCRIKPLWSLYSAAEQIIHVVVVLILFVYDNVSDSLCCLNSGRHGDITVSKIDTKLKKVTLNQ